MASHSFHIPVLGLAFSIDTPLKVAKYGIASVISIVDDDLIERMRAYYAGVYNKVFTPINKDKLDARASRIKAYLDFMSDIIAAQMADLREQDFSSSTAVQQYFQLLPELHPAKRLYQQFRESTDPEYQIELKKQLLPYLQAGPIDVNIMSKVDKLDKDASGQLLDEKYADALAALRGFAASKVQSSVVLSAGMNPRLYAYIAQRTEFYPDPNGHFNKKIILKVSDYRSALIQAKYLAKKGLWVSEFRIESGLNCGGHAFATEGYLLGPILAEFKTKRQALQEELATLYTAALRAKDIKLKKVPNLLLTVQGGVGTAAEHDFLLQHYGMDAVGWGSPFLLVPEASTVDQATLHALTVATEEDFYVSTASPLGVPFNNFRQSTAELERLQRIEQGRPGNPCTKKLLVSNTEFTSEAICTASRTYQHLKLKELQSAKLNKEAYQQKFEEITTKTCLCEGLVKSAYLHYGLLKPKESKAVAICPGPNIAYFKKQYSLQQMVDHIYGREDLLQNISRPLFFINELHLYVSHLQTYVEKNKQSVNAKKEKYVQQFKTQLLTGIAYYKTLKNQISNLPSLGFLTIDQHLKEAQLRIEAIQWVDL